MKHVCNLACLLISLNDGYFYSMGNRGVGFTFKLIEQLSSIRSWIVLTIDASLSVLAGSLAFLFLEFSVSNGRSVRALGLWFVVQIILVGFLRVQKYSWRLFSARDSYRLGKSLLVIAPASALMLAMIYRDIEIVKFSFSAKIN